GNRTSVTDALQNQTTFAYNAGDRLITITYPGGSTTSFTYDSRGRRTSVTDQNGKTTSYVYDDADRLTSVTDAANHVTTYAYDTEDNLTSILDANGHSTFFTYDAFGRVTQTNFPSTLSETYAYDANNNLTSKTDGKGQTITYVYDALNRHLLPAGAHPQRHQHGQRNHFSPAAHLQVDRIQVEIHDPFGGQVALLPSLVAFLQPRHQAAHRALRQRRLSQQRRERRANAPRVPARQIHAQHRLLDFRRRAPVARQQLALPFPLVSVRRQAPRSRHGDAHGSSPQHQPPRLAAVAIAAPARRALGALRSQRILHFLLQNLRDEFAHPLPQPLLQTLPPGI